jgi:hypothetical protein
MHAREEEFDACEVCGRNMLSGERTHPYVSPEGERRAVCDVCRVRVQSAGWSRADRSAQQPPPSEEQPKRRGRRRVPRIGPNRPRERPRRPGETPQRRVRRALDGFNSSEHRRTVAGLIRSLGEPKVSAVAPSERPDQVRLTVAWDLAWYQWEVRLAEAEPSVRSLGKGSEVGQLPPADRAWNARAADDGELRFGLGSNGGGK